MSDATPPFAFSQFVPGFDFLKSLTGASGTSGGAVPGMPSLSNWVAPTLSVEELDKRIQELKTVQYWLEQNGHALKATIQALEVQKMTLSTLRGMNVQMEDLAKVFTRGAAITTATTAATVAPEAADTAAPAPAEAAPSAPEAGDAAPGVVDPLQWWNALTQQFQHIAQSALQDAAHLRKPGMAPAQDQGATAGPAGAAPAHTARAATPRKKAPVAAKKAAPRRPRAG